jgi:transcription elongation factor GreB
VSKAFTKDDADVVAVVVAPRAPLPAGVPNYVTPAGLASLRAELSRLLDERSTSQGSREEPERDRTRLALTMRIEALEARIASAEIIDPHAGPQDTIRFGATVTLRHEDGAEQRWKIVGVDEADARNGRITFVSPLARAMLGKRVGDVATVKTPHGEEELTVVALAYDDE